MHPPAKTGGAPNTRIPRFVAQLPSEEQSDVDALLILHTLCHRKTISAIDAAPILQKREESAQAALERLAEDRVEMIEPTRGTARLRFPKYRLREGAIRDLGTAVRYNRRLVDQTDRRVVAHVREYGVITNRTIRNLFDVNVERARDLLTDLVRRELLVKTSQASRGPSVTYGPGPKFPHSKGRRRRHVTDGGHSGAERSNGAGGDDRDPTGLERRQTRIDFADEASKEP